MLSGRGLCDELITRPEESYRLWRVVVYDLKTSRIGAPYIYDISNLRVNGILKIKLCKLTTKLISKCLIRFGPKGFYCVFRSEVKEKPILLPKYYFTYVNAALRPNILCNYRSRHGHHKNTVFC